MQVIFIKKFQKEYRKLSEKAKQQTDKRIELFIKNPKHRTLNAHPLKGDKQQFWSINISGDLRALYEQHDSVFIFHRIGSHSELYE